MRRKGGYSLLEALIAGAVLAMAIAGVSALAVSMVRQHEWSAATRVMLNAQEQAAKLYHLGLNASQITNLLPMTCVATNAPPQDALFLSFSNFTTNITNAGPMELSHCEAVFVSHFNPGGSPVRRTNRVLLARPIYR